MSAGRGLIRAIGEALSEAPAETQEEVLHAFLEWRRRRAGRPLKVPMLRWLDEEIEDALAPWEDDE